MNKKIVKMAPALGYHLELGIHIISFGLFVSVEHAEELTDPMRIKIIRLLWDREVEVEVEVGE